MTLTDQKILVQALIDEGMDNELRRIRSEYTKFLPIELIHIDDRVICEIIDEYFKNQTIRI